MACLHRVWGVGERPGLGDGGAVPPQPLGSTPSTVATLQKSAFVSVWLLVYFFLPEAVKRHFPDSSLPKGLLQPLERLPCLPPPPRPPRALASWGAAWKADVPTGLRAMARAQCVASAQQADQASSQPFFLCQPQLLTKLLTPGRPSPHCPHHTEGWGCKAGMAQPSSSKRLPASRPLCGVVKLLAGSALLPFPAQNSMLVTLPTKGPYFPPSFIRSGFGLTGSGYGDLDRNREALPLTPQAER